MTPDEIRQLGKYAMVWVRTAPDVTVPAMVNQPAKDGLTVAVWTQHEATGAFVVPSRAEAADVERA